MKRLGLDCVTILARLSLAGCNNLASQSHKAASSSSITPTKVVKHHKANKKAASESSKDKQSSSNSSSQVSNSSATSQQSSNGQNATAQSNNGNNSNQQQVQGSSQQGGINNADQALAAARAKYGDGNGNYHWTVMYDADTGQPIRNDDGSYFVKAIDPTQGTMTGTAQSVNVYPDGSMTNN